MPKGTSEMQSLRGLTNRYSAFPQTLQDFWALTSHLSRKDAWWYWRPDCENQLARLNTVPNTDIRLKHYDPTRHEEVVDDAAD
ncbi:hypothetical protein EG68_10294 [Paragonimus skrjabini miyazakii]|uniref:Uncharacterized protein n=1 Tax=Paragonimus skrjabini miyazakii TaxID=59628 RepID=A0A8S9YNR2_9TREM|nr:hypothetical protein EG68_10294 [Paragonimus skrjabini miyazakii]